MYEEDVFWRYERNSLKYFNCIKLGKNCPNLCDNICYCCTEATVFPVTIGDQDIKCSLHTKTYVKIGDECAICLENIVHKSNTYLTGCGHSFHRSCLFKVLETRWSEKPLSILKCPCCRCGLGTPEFLERYNCESNGLDKLENFWLVKDFIIPEYCRNNSHYLGMKRECVTCEKYRTLGI